MSRPSSAMSNRLPDARLAGSLALVAPDLPEELVPPSAAAALTELAGTLPPVHVAGFECRLAKDDEAVDLQQAVFAHEDHAALMARWLARADSLSPAWQRVLRVCSDWPAGVDELWLEFDPEPSLFAVVAPDGDARAVLQRLADVPADPMLDRIAEGASPPARVSHLGVMQGRPGAGLRIQASHVPLESLDVFLRDVGWPGDVPRAVELAWLLLDQGDQVTLCFDVLYGELLPRLGLECSFFQRRGVDKRWRPLLDRLAAEGLAAPAKADALLAWPGAVTPLGAPAPWPDDLLAASLGRPADELGFIDRRLSHVKLTLDPVAPVSAKAYFGYGHVRLPAAPREPNPRPVPAVSPAPTLDDAIARAVDFLLRARTQGGWWRDFFDRAHAGDADRRILRDASDEWVTAYVANVMAVAPLPAARAAAEHAFALLMRRRESGGWGWDASWPPDADTTTWVLRLARLLDAPESLRLDEARAFLTRMTSASGAVSTYGDEDQAWLRQVVAIDGVASADEDLIGWRAGHTCVTAAAASLGGEPLLTHLRDAQRDDGSWAAYWWEDDEYATALAVEALAPHPAYADVVARGAAWALARPTGSAFATALAVRAVVAGAGSPQPAAIESLLRTQRKDGSWAPSAHVRMPWPDVVEPSSSTRTLTYADDEDALFTSATVLWALSAVAARA